MLRSSQSSLYLTIFLKSFNSVALKEVNPAMLVLNSEEEKIDAEAADYESEIALIAQQSDMPERRVRARLEKSGQMDALRNQIVERKVIEKIIKEAKVSEEKVTKKAEKEADEFAVFHNVLRTKDDAAIPEAKYDDNIVPGAEKEKEKEKD